MANGILKTLALGNDDPGKRRNQAELGASLMESGLSQMGNPGAGKAIGEYLRQEWWRKEAENFNATTGKDVQSKLTSSLDSYRKKTRLTQEVGVEGQDPAELRKGYYNDFDPMTGAPVADSFIPADDQMAVNQHLNTSASDLIGGLQGISMEYMDAAAQYPNNPLIETAAKGMMNHITGTFDGQLTAIKMADQQADQRSQAMDIERKQRDAQLDKELLPLKTRSEAAKMRGDIFDLKDRKLTARAEVARGREIAMLAGHDVSSMGDSDFVVEYRKHLAKLKEETLIANNARSKGKDLVPEGVDLHNVGDWLKYSPKGQGVLESFWAEEQMKAMRDPAVKDRLDKGAQTQGAKDFDDLETLDSVKAQVLKKKVLQDADVWEGTQTTAVKRATEYLIDTNQMIGKSFGIGEGKDTGVPLPLSDNGPMTIKLFDNAQDMMKAVKPELYQDEVSDKVEVPNEDPENYYSGDPQDPYGDQNVDPNSPVSEQRQSREVKVLENYTDWLNTFAEDKTMPDSVKRSHAKRALKDINSSIDALVTRQSLYGQGLPQEQYDAKLADLLSLKANFGALAQNPKHMKINSDLGIDNMIQTVRKSVDLMMSDSIAGLSQLENENRSNVPLQGDKPHGIFVRKEQARRGGKGLLTEAKESAEPYWLAPPEEKAKRQADFKQYMNEIER